MAHFTFSHYSAITESDRSQFRLADEHLHFDSWIESDILNEQLSGYFLIPGGNSIPSGFVEVSDSEAKTIFGRHCVHGRDDEGDECDTGCNGEDPMASYSFKLLNPGLSIGDTPIKYKAPFGPSVAFKLTYNQRAPAIDDIPQHGNLGPRWTHSYAAYMRLDSSLIPIPPGGNASTPRACTQVSFVNSEGHYYKYTYNTTTGTYTTKFASRPRLEWYLNGGQSAYVLLYSDGSSQHFQQANGTTATRYYLTKIVDARGNELNLTYDSEVRLVTLTDALGKVTTLSYTPEPGDGVPTDYKKIRKITDPFSREAKLYYNSQGRLQKIIDPVNIVSEFNYGAGDFIDRLTTPYGVTSFAWGELPGINSEPGRFIEATDPLGNKERAEATDLADVPTTDPSPAPTSVTVNGQSVSFLPKVTELNYRNTYYWDKKMWRMAPGDYSKARIYNWLAVNDSITSVLGSTKEPLEGRVWRNYPGQVSAHAPGNLNSPSKIVRSVEKPDGSRAWVMEQHSYDTTFGNLIGTIDPEGRETRTNYASNGIDVLSVETKDGATWRTLRSYSNYTDHLPGVITEASGLQTTMTYNSQGQPTLINQSKGGQSENIRLTYDRNLDGTPDSDGYLIKVEKTDPNNASGYVTLSEFTYDAAGRVRTTKNPDGYVITLDYDNIDRVTLVTHPDGTTEQTVYDKLDPVAQKDRGGLWSRTYFDALRKPVIVQDPAGRITQLEWCKCGDIQKIIDPNGKLTHWKRDEQGRVFEKIYPDGTKEQMTYQPYSGRLATTTRPGDTAPTVTYQYSLSGHLTEEDYTSASTPDVTYTYADYLGRPTQRLDGIGTTVFGYHPLDGSTPGAGALATVNGPWVDDTLAYSHDWQDRLVTRQVKTDSGTVTREETVSYDSLDRMTSVINDVGTFQYIFNSGNNGNRINRITAPGGLQTDFGYYALSAPDSKALKLQSLVHTLGGTTPISSFGYDYDASHRIKRWEQTQNGVFNAFELEYDRSSQLIEAVKKNSGGTILEEKSWRYDGGGNRLMANTSAGTVTSFYNNLNQMERVGGAGATLIEGTVDETATVKVNNEPAEMSSIPPGSGEMIFRKMINVTEGSNTVAIEAKDANNNVQSEDWQFNVTGVQKNLTYDSAGNTLTDGTRTYTWDTANRLKSVTIGADTYAWDYDGLSRRVVEKKNGSVTKRFVWDGLELVQERSGANALIRNYYDEGYKEGSNTFSFTKDHLGSIREVLDASGTVVARYSYDFWGVRTKLSGSIDTPWGFTGHYTHTETGLILAPFRAYDAELGRWLSRDPFGESDGTNLYGYVGGDPINHYDPNGLWQVTIRGGWEGAGEITFGLNQGRFNFGVGVGYGAGFVVNWDKTNSDTDLNDPCPSDGVIESAGRFGVNYSAAAGFGVYAGVSAEFDHGLEADGNSNFFFGLQTNAAGNILGVERGLQNQFGMQGNACDVTASLRNQTSATTGYTVGAGAFGLYRVGVTF